MAKKTKTARYDALRESLKADPGFRVRAIRLTYFKGVISAYSGELHLSNASHHLAMVNNPDVRLRLVRADNSRDNHVLFGKGIFQGIPLGRLFQINRDGEMRYDLITTEEHAEADLKKLRRVLNKHKQLVLESNLSAVHTSCKNCIFAQYSSNTQYGCGFKNRIEKFKAIDENLVVEAYDADKEFFIINGRLCSAYRDQAWVNKQKGKGGELGKSEAIVEKEIRVRADFVIILTDDTTDEQLIETLDSLKASTMEPFTVVVVNNSNKRRMPRLVSFMNAHAGDLPWYVTNIIERDGDNLVDDNRAFDLGAEKCEGHFYSNVPVGTKVPPKLVEGINKFINDELGQFILLKGDEQVPINITHSAFFKHVQGSKALVLHPEDGEPKTLKSLVEKAEFMSGDKTHLVRKTSELCY